jgi:Thioredoxin
MMLRAWIGITVALATAAFLLTLSLLSHPNSEAAAESRMEHEVSALFAGISQDGATLGDRSAPVTLEVFSDLEDPDSRNWFVGYLPAIVRDDVRSGAIKIQYRSYKTNTYYPATFVKQQTAALAAGAQHKLWNFIDTFYHEQGKELTPYVTENYLNDIAEQVPGLNLTHWHAARHTGRREEQTATEDQTARTTLGLHVTPSFRIGPTGGQMKDFSGRHILKHEQQRPIALIEAQDITQAIEELDPNR